jgi:hypothetical protein
LEAQPRADEQTSTAGAVAEEARTVASSATSATQEVAHTAVEQATQVAGEAATQARDLLAQVKDEVSGQLESQTRRLAETLRSTAQELEGMAAGSGAGSTSHQLVQTLAGKGTQLADLIERQGPGGLVQSLQDLGRRRPGAFLLGAVAAGVAVGRMGRAARAAAGTSSPAPSYEAPSQGRPLAGATTGSSTSPGMSSGMGSAMGSGAATEGQDPMPPAPTQQDPMPTVVLPETGHRTQ